MPYTVMIVVAAGSSTRMGCAKQDISLCGEPVLLRTLRVLQSVPAVDELLLVARPEDMERYRALASAAGITKLHTAVPAAAAASARCSAGWRRCRRRRCWWESMMGRARW